MEQGKLKELSTRIEGVASDNTATTQSVTELKQTVTGLDARVSQNTTTANGAMSKATSVQTAQRHQGRFERKLYDHREVR